METDEDLHAVEDIRNLVGRYCDALSRLDLQAVGECWTDDGIWTLFDEDITGRRAILAAIRELTTRLDWIVQHANSPVIEVDGDTATGCWQIAEYARRSSGGSSRPSTSARKAVLTLTSFHRTLSHSSVGAARIEVI